MKKIRRILVLLLVAVCVSSAAAQEVVPLVKEDVSPEVKADSVVKKESFFKRLGRYLTSTDDADPRAISKFSIIGGPHYDTEKKFGLGLVGTSQFRLRGCDELMQPSNVSMSVDVSFRGFVSVGVKGNIFFPDDSKRLLVDADFKYSPTYYWGMGYDNGDNDANETKMKKTSTMLRADFMWRLAPHLYLGPMLEWQSAHTQPLERPELLEGQRMTVYNIGVGFTLDYDTRNYVTAPTRGVYLHYSQLFNPKFCNKYYYTMTDLRACGYIGAWRGGVIAGEVQAQFNFGKPSWAAMAQLGSSNSMRGYYPGRYRDKHMVTAQVELRQTIYGPVGAVVWGGAGTVFHNSDTFCNKVLPNFGIGLRWSFRPHVNIRLDYGFGKSRQNGFMFAINEAF